MAQCWGCIQDGVIDVPVATHERFLYGKMEPLCASCAASYDSALRDAQAGNRLDQFGNAAIKGGCALLATPFLVFFAVVPVVF